MQITEQRDTFAFRGGRLAYQRWGHGPAVLLCVHGIGQTGSVFAPIGMTLADRFTIYAFDLFYHGQSSALHGETFSPNELLTPADWRELLTLFLAQHAIARFSVAGFSLGGRFAMATVAAFADRLDELWLFAPDGITVSPWYALATRSASGRQLFRWVLNHTAWLSRAGQVLVRLGWLNPSLLRFVEVLLATPAQRKQVYQAWLAFRPLYLSPGSVADLLNQHSVRVRVFLGFFDRIVPPATVQPLLQRLHQYELQMLKVSHNRLIEQVAETGFPAPPA